jgi:hypothetical protein
MTNNLSFCYHADMTTKGLGLGSAKVEGDKEIKEKFEILNGQSEAVHQRTDNTMV